MMQCSVSHFVEAARFHAVILNLMERWASPARNENKYQFDLEWIPADTKLTWGPSID